MQFQTKLQEEEPRSKQAPVQKLKLPHASLEPKQNQFAILLKHIQKYDCSQTPSRQLKRKAEG